MNQDTVVNLATQAMMLSLKIAGPVLLLGLIIGLLVSTATGEFNAEDHGIEKFATDSILLDRVLERFGPEAKVARGMLRRAVARVVEHRRRGRGSGERPIIAHIGP